MRAGMVVPALLTVAAAGSLVLVFSSTASAAPRRAAKLPSDIVKIAKKWAAARGLPPNWVLATIVVESGGNPNLVGDSGGRSIGLMQVNSIAHADRLAAAGVTREMLFDPDTNVKWGTLLLREVYDQVKKALVGRTPPAPIDVIVRLAYKGPTPVIQALQSGRDPRTLSYAPPSVLAWNDALARTAGLV